MKTTLLMVVVAVASYAVGAEPLTTRPMQAEVLHTTSVRAMTPAGFAHDRVTLKKGKVFPVVERRDNVVVLDTEGGRVRVSPADVKVTPRAAALTAQAGATASAK